MEERSFDEMIAYFNRKVSEMDIAQDYKMELLGMVTALGYKYEKSVQPKWIPVKAHPATDEERESNPDIDYWFDCELPDDGQEILVTVKHKDWIGVEKDVCYADGSYSLDSGYDWLDDIIAWMSLPKPYTERR